jgi:hypothetical protein
MIKDYKQHNLGVCVFEEIMEPLHWRFVDLAIVE